MNNAVLRCLFDEAKTYGPHSVGLVYYDKELMQFKSFKRAIHPSQFLRNCNHRVERAARFSLGYGHVRYATHGGISDQTAHPFVYDLMIYAHNGVISNYREIAAEYRLGPITVDSQCFGPLIKNRTIGKAHGSTGLIWADTSTLGGLYVYKHHQGLEAAKCEIDGKPVTIVASRTVIINNVARRMKHAFKLIDFEQFKEYTAYQVCDTGIIEAWSCKPSAPVHYVPSALPVSCRHLVESEATTTTTTTAPPLAKEAVMQLARNVANRYNILVVTEPFMDTLRIYNATPDQVLEVISDLIVSEDEFTLHGATHGDDESWTSKVLATRDTDGNVKCHNEDVRTLINHVSL